MKKYIKLIPLILYPYLWIICVIVGLWMESFEIDIQETPLAYLLNVGSILMPLIVLYCLGVSVLSAILQKNYSPAEAAGLNMLVKLLHIPAYIINFIVGVVGIPAIALYGLGIFIIELMIAIDISTIIFTGMQAVGASINMYKKRVINKAFCVIYSIMSFVFCADVVVAIAMYIQARIGMKKKEK